MTDISARSSDRARSRADDRVEARWADDAARVRQDELVAFVELIFFAYRDFTGEADAVLSQFGFGRAHHRVLHFVNRKPGLRVADLLDILKITKQSAARVLKELIEKGYIVQKAGREDRRERLLFATAKGARLADQLSGLQAARVARALAAAGPDAAAAVRTFLTGMISEPERRRIHALVFQEDARVHEEGHP
jgi:DNA-binding MarR family transcriptional regulator